MGAGWCAAGRGTRMTSSAHVSHGAPRWLISLVRRLEGEARLDVAARWLHRFTAPLGRPRPRQALTGAWLGHALHPLLTDFPLGAWMSATLLDLFGRRRSQAAAQGLVAFGVVMAVPTAAAGLAEWREAGERDRRVGVLHGLVNTLAAVCYAASLVPRGRARRGAAAGLSLAGGVAATLSGYLGGHLSLVRKVGTMDSAFVDPEGPGPGP